MIKHTNIIIKQVISIALLLLLAACGGNDIVHKPHALVTLDAPITITNNWTVDIGVPDNRQIQKLQPFVFNNKVYTVDTAGEINVIDENGEIIWQKQSALQTSSIATNGKLIVVTTIDGKVIAYSNKTFKQQWLYDLSTSILVKPLFVDDKVLIRSIVGKITAHSLFDGSLQWSYQQHTPVLSSRGSSDMILDDNKIIVGFDNGYLSVINPINGKAFWEKLVCQTEGQTELDRINDIDAQMLVENGFVYFIGSDNLLKKYNIKTAQKVWQVKQTSTTGISSNKSLLFVTDKDSNIVAISKDTGITVWTQDKLQYRNATMPTVFNNQLLIGDIEGYIHVLSANTGKIIGRQLIDVYGINIHPVINNKNIYVQSLGSYLTSLSL